MRALIFELRPGNLEQDGLVRALKTHTASLQGRIGLPVVVESTLDERLPLPVEETLYRIAQEALHNVVKHAGAHQVRLEIRRTPNGGAPAHRPTTARASTRARSRTAISGSPGCRPGPPGSAASFSCRSEVGKGTTIEVVVDDAGARRARRAPRTQLPSGVHPRPMT